jgi:uncharacterized membrane protein YqjE
MDSHVDTHGNTESIGGLLRGILTDVRELIREEIALAKVEIGEQLTGIRAASISFAVAAVAILFCLGFVLVALAMGIADLLMWPVWSGFLIVAVLLGIVGLTAMASGRRKLRTVSAMPEETVTTLKENSEWIATRLSSVRR